MEEVKNIRLNGAENKPIAVDIFFENREPNPVVMYAHGFNGFKDWGNFDLIARQFAHAGFAFIKFNFSHNGTTPEHPEDFVDLEAFGHNSYTKELLDLQIVIDWVLGESHPYADAMDKNRVYLIGHSMGGGIVLLKGAEEKRVKGITTWAAIGACKTPWGSWPKEKMEEWQKTGVQYTTNSRTKQELPLYYQLYKDYEHNKDRLNIIVATKNLKVPLLICHGRRDEAVPVEVALDLKKANERADLFLVDSDHVFGRKHPWQESELPEAMQAVVNKTISFFQQL